MKVAQAEALLRQRALVQTTTTFAGTLATGSLGVLRLSTRPGDSAAPSLAVALASDTGLGATDRITADPAMTGSASDAGGIAVLRGGLDNAAAADFVDLLARLQPDGSFAVSANDMAGLAGGTLAEGPHVLHLLAVDLRGNARSLDFNFTFSNTKSPPPIRTARNWPRRSCRCRTAATPGCSWMHRCRAAR